MDPQLIAVRKAQREKFEAAQRKAAEEGSVTAPPLAASAGSLAPTRVESVIASSMPASAVSLGPARAQPPGAATLGATSSEPSKRKAGGILDGLSAEMLNRPICSLLADAPPPVPKRPRVDPDAFRVPPERTAEIRRLLNEPAPPELRILSWNIDGLDQVGGNQAMYLRTLHVALEVARQRPAVVLLQEAIPPALEMLSAPQILGNFYEFLTPRNPPQPYYAAILLDKKRTKKLGFTEIDFPSSQMGRQLLAATVEFPGHRGPPLVVSTAHLESTKDQAPERKKQLARGMRFLRDALTSSSQLAGRPGAAILAGDLNLRDEEVKAVQRDLQGVAQDIADGWSFCGSPEVGRWTWDTGANDNCAANYKCKCRFDRLFFLSPGISEYSPELAMGAAGAKGSGKAKVKAAPATAAVSPTGDGWRPTSFRTIGKERVPGLGRFPSDHWGILTTWSPVSGGSVKSCHSAPAVPIAAVARAAVGNILGPPAGLAMNLSHTSTPAPARSHGALQAAGRAAAGAHAPLPAGVDDDEDDPDLKAALALSLALSSGQEQVAAPTSNWSSSCLGRTTEDIIDLDD